MELDDEKLSFSKKVVGTVTWLFVGIIMFFGRHLVNIQRNTGQADRLC